MNQQRFARIAVIGATGGIGQALVQRLEESDGVEEIFACARSPGVLCSGKTVPVELDLNNESSIQSAADCIEGQLDLVIIASGMLEDGDHLPEKSLKGIDLSAMKQCFTVNTFGPALVAKHFLPLLSRDRRAVFAALSARVGSISDNRSGGWYSYRASKAALNMLIKTAAIEVARRYPEAVLIGLHPGTVNTALSKPFTGRIKHAVFSPEQSADYLLEVINNVTAQDSGLCFDWQGQRVEP